MRTTGAAMVNAIFVALFLSCPAFAHCDLADFDKGAPAALHGAINSSSVEFEYASDADTIAGPHGSYQRIWNYVHNIRKDKSIGVRWTKAGIAQPLTRPLPPDETACNISSADTFSKDSDAPIVYGTNDQVQQAEVFIPQDHRKLGATDSTIGTSYQNEDGKIVDVNVQFSTAETQKGVSFVLQHSPGVVVGIAGLPTAFSSSELEMMIDAAEKQDSEVQRATYIEYTKQDPKEIADLFQPEKGPTAKTDFLFFSGSAKFGVEIPTSNVEQVSADMIILDAKNRRPIFATGISLLVPRK